MIDAPVTAAEARRNYRLSIANGALFLSGAALLAPETIFAGLIDRLTGSPFCVTLAQSLVVTGWLWPQLFIGSFVEHRKRKMPVYVISVAIRLGALLIMAAGLWLFPEHDWLLFWIVLGSMMLFTTGGGVSGLAFADIVAKSVPHRRHSWMFAWRRTLGNGLGALTGLAAARVLNEEAGLAYPYSYITLVIGGVMMCGVANLLFIMIREPDSPVEGQSRPFKDYLRSGFAIFIEDHNYRRFFVVRVTATLAIIANALHVPFALRTLGASEDRVAFFVVFSTLGGVGGSLFWGWLSNHRSTLTLLKASTLMLIIGPLLGVVLSLMVHFPLTRNLAQQYYMWFYAIIFASMAMAVAGRAVSSMVYMFAIAPADRRPAYIAFMSTMLTPFTLAPMLAGVIAEKVSYTLAFGLALTFGVVALLSSYTLDPNPRPHA